MVAPVRTSPKYHMDWLKHEQDTQLGRREITIPAGTGNHLTGTLLGRVTATLKCVPWAPAATDGSETVYGILLHGIDARGTDDVRGVAVVADALVADTALEWPAGMTAAQRAVAIAVLAAKNIQTVRMY